MVEQKLLDKAYQLTTALLKQMEVDAKVVVGEREGVITIDIESADSGLLIGYHAETLQALQLVLGMMLNQQQGEEEWQQVVVDIGGYRQQREQTLKRMAQRAARQVRELVEAQELPAMPSFERRLVHLYIAEEEGVVSESRGTGSSRRVVVKPANN